MVTPGELRAIAQEIKWARDDIHRMLVVPARFRKRSALSATDRLTDALARLELAQRDALEEEGFICGCHVVEPEDLVDLAEEAAEAAV